MMVKTFLLILTALFTLSVSFADEDNKDKNKAKVSKEKAEFLERYEPTGKILRCVNLTQIRDTDILDDQNIAFIMSHKKAYVNELPRRCPRLEMEDAFGYQLSTSRLCNMDMISVINRNGGGVYNRCGLGKFTEYKKISKTAAKAETSQ